MPRPESRIVRGNAVPTLPLRSNPHSSSLLLTFSVRLRGFLPWGLPDICRHTSPGRSRRQMCPTAGALMAYPKAIGAVCCPKYLGGLYLCGTAWHRTLRMTIREHLKVRYRLMGWGVMTIPALGFFWLHSSTPLNHKFRVTAIGMAEIAVMLLYLLSFKCPNCQASLTAVSRQILFR